MLKSSWIEGDAGGKIGSENLALQPAAGQLGGVTQAFLGYVRGKRTLMFYLLGLTAFLTVLAVTQGAYDITPGHLLRILMGAAVGPADIVIWKIRLPRIISAIVVGWGLSLSGLSIQSLLKNPLGSPSTLGISQGAAFGAAAAIVLFGRQMISVTAFAFAGAMGATAVIMVLAGIRRLSSEAIILSGVALSSLFASATVLVQYLASDTQLAVIVFWTFGDVARAGWSEIGMLTGAVTVASLFLVSRRWDLNAMAAGEDTARGLGVNVGRMRIYGMLAAALVAALATAFHGVIAFVGLIAPHIAKRLVGTDHGLLIPFSAIIGALLLLGADTIGRALIGSGAMPVGIVTSFMGAPMFLFLLVRGYR